MTKTSLRCKAPTYLPTEAICEVPFETLNFLTDLLYYHRKAHDIRPKQRAGTLRTQAKLVLAVVPRWHPSGGAGSGPSSFPR